MSYTSRVRLLSRAPRNDETWRAQVDVDDVVIVNEGYLVQIVARLPRPSLCSLRAFNHHVASQVHDTADRTKILNTGTNWPNPTTGFAAHTNIAFESRTGGITVSFPGKAWIGVRDPRPLRPPARKRRNSKRRPIVTPSP